MQHNEVPIRVWTGVVRYSLRAPSPNQTVTMLALIRRIPSEEFSLEQVRPDIWKDCRVQSDRRAAPRLSSPHPGVMTCMSVGQALPRRCCPQFQSILDSISVGQALELYRGLNQRPNLLWKGTPRIFKSSEVVRGMRECMATRLSGSLTTSAFWGSVVSRVFQRS
jgi:hypothetical protein